MYILVLTRNQRNYRVVKRFIFDCIIFFCTGQYTKEGVRNGKYHLDTRTIFHVL